MKQDYIIAGHRIRIEGRKLVEAMMSMSGFNVFKTEESGEPVCKYILHEFEMPLFEKVQYISETEIGIGKFGSCNGGYLLDFTPPTGKPLKVWMSKDGSTARFSGNFDAHILRFACWLAYGLATIPFQTVAIHTSAIQYKDKAVLFLGESGTGKSTHTRLWRENIQGTLLLNDDSPIVRIMNGKSWVFGSPWSGKTHCYKNEKYELAACVRLSQAPYNRIQKLNIIQSYGALHPSCPPFFAYDDVLYDPISKFLGQLISSVPVYHMACLPDAAAARLSFETIFELCGK